MKSILTRISDMGPETVVITGFKDENGQYANMAYSRVKNIFWRVEYENIPVQYPGTGDIFTSVLAGGIIKGDSLPIALDRATQFLSLAVETTYACGTPAREGVLLEKVLGWLGLDLTQCTYKEV
jgi:pyridoxine kinase